MWQRVLIVLGVTLIGGGVRGSREAMAAPQAPAPPASSDAIEVTYDIALDRAIDDRTVEARRELELGLADAKIAATVRLPAEPGALTIIPGEAARRADIERMIKSGFSDALAPRSCNPHTEAGAICMQISPGFVHAIRAAALDHAAAVVRARLEALAVGQVKVTTKREQIVVVLPAGNRPEVETARQVIEAPGRLDWKVVDDGSDYMKHLFQHVGSTGKDDAPTDAQATGLGIHARVDAWRDEAGARHYDYYLDAPDREESVPPSWAAKHGCGKGKPAPEPGKVRCTVTGRALIERYLFGDRDLGVAGLTSDPTLRVPDDREIGFELAATADGNRVWRTYYVERRAALSGTRIDNAFTSTDPNTHATTVIVELDRLGARQLAELTAQRVGHKVAFVLDGTIKSAPIVSGPINGGKVAITMGRDAVADGARLLAIALKSGSLPAPLIKSSVNPVKR